MYTDELTALEETYDNLISNVSLENIRAFLNACWLIENNQILSETSLERLVYIEGDQQEVYTRMERKIISSVSKRVFSSSFQLESIVGTTIDCWLFVIELSSEVSTIYDSIASMKILNKAFDGLKLFMFISQADLHFGCSLLSKDTINDCMLSYAINSKTDWALLADTFLYRNDSKKIHEFYSGVLCSFEGIKSCQKDIYEDDLNYRLTDFENMYDIDALEENPKLYIETFAPIHSTAKYGITAEFERRIYIFEREVTSCMEELSDIKKSHVNPIEMRFAAEQALLVSEQQETFDEKRKTILEETENVSDIGLLDDPILLMKKLKKDRGL